MMILISCLIHHNRILFLRRSGGYKISALHVERLLLAHPDIKEIAIVGISDDVYGQKIGAIIVQDTKKEAINEARVCTEMGKSLHLVKKVF